MKTKIAIKTVIAALIFILPQIFCVGCGYTKQETEITLCVYADSRAEMSQRAAEKVAAVVYDYLNGGGAPQSERELCGCVCAVADAVLARLGLGYASAARLNGSELTLTLGCGDGGKTVAVCGCADDALYKSVIAEIAKKYF